MYKDIVNIIIEHRKEIFPNKRIKDVECLSIQEYKLSWIYKLRFNKTDIVVAKVYKKPRITGDEIKDAAQKEYQALKFLEERFSGQEEFRIVRPLGYMAEKNIIFFEQIHGMTASDFIKQNLAWLSSEQKISQGEEIFFRIGGWLKFFQKNTAKSDKPEFNLNEFKSKIKKKYQECKELGLYLSADGLIEECLTRIFNNFQEEKIAMVGRHGDFTPWNVYIAGQKVYVIDFSDFEYGFPYDDLTVFLITLEVYKNHFGVLKKNITRLKQSFCRGYGEDVGNTSYYHLFMFYNILEVLSWANHIVVKHIYHKMAKRRHIKFYERVLKKYCLSIVENEE